MREEGRQVLTTAPPRAMGRIRSIELVVSHSRQEGYHMVIYKSTADLGKAVGQFAVSS